MMVTLFIEEQKHRERIEWRESNFDLKVEKGFNVGSKCLFSTTKIRG